MNSWLEVQRSILEDWIIAEIEVDNITPVRIGGYNARPFTNRFKLAESVRTQNIKGLWRWWARALMGGALLSNQKKLPSSLSEVNKEVSKLLGSTKESSYFFIQLDEKSSSFISSDELKNIPRVKLVTMGLEGEEKKEEQYYKQLSFKLTFGARRILDERDKDAAMFALSSLLISLIFSGIGSMTTRGFGKLKINSLKSRSQLLKNEVDGLNRVLTELYGQTTESGITNGLKSLILKSLSYASNYKSLGGKVEGVKINGLPPFPILLPDCKPDIFRLETICIAKSSNIVNILECLGQSTLKSQWRQLLASNTKALHTWVLASNTKALHTWVLGLPRYQELHYNGGKRKELTGYILDNEKERRRTSPIAFTLLKYRSDFALVMYGFVTGELAELLRGYRTGNRYLTLNHVSVQAKIRGKIPPEGIKRTKVYEDILRRGIAVLGGRPKRINRDLSIESVYQECFEAGWQFVREIIKRRCCG